MCVGRYVNVAVVVVVVLLLLLLMVNRNDTRMQTTEQATIGSGFYKWDGDERYVHGCACGYAEEM